MRPNPVAAGSVAVGSPAGCKRSVVPDKMDKDGGMTAKNATRKHDGMKLSRRFVFRRLVSR